MKINRRIIFFFLTYETYVFNTFPKNIVFQHLNMNNRTNHILLYKINYKLQKYYLF